METPRRQRKPKALRLHRAPPQSLPRAARWPQLQHLPKRPRQGLQAWERLRREEKASRTEPRNCEQGWSGLRPQTFDVQRTRRPDRSQDGRERSRSRQRDRRRKENRSRRRKERAPSPERPPRESPAPSPPRRRTGAVKGSAEEGRCPHCWKKPAGGESGLRMHQQGTFCRACPPKRLSRRPLLRSPRRPPRRQWTEARTLKTSATATGRSLCGSCLDAKASASLHRHRHGLADREATAMAEPAVVALLVEAGFPQCLLSGGIRAPPKAKN